MVQNLLLSRFLFALSRFFFTAFLYTIRPINLINLAIFIILKNVPILDQKSRFFKDFVPLLVLDRLVGMQHNYTENSLVLNGSHNQHAGSHGSLIYHTYGFTGAHDSLGSHGSHGSHRSLVHMAHMVQGCPQKFLNR